MNCCAGGTAAAEQGLDDLLTMSRVTSRPGRTTLA